MIDNQVMRVDHTLFLSLIFWDCRHARAHTHTHLDALWADTSTTSSSHSLSSTFADRRYSLILLLLLRGFRINLTIWLLDAALGVTAKLAELSSKHLYRWGIIFYHQHRLAHLPVVYTQVPHTRSTRTHTHA